MLTLSRALVIAIDGPAASGKGTIARMLARHFDLPHLDTGLTYRAVAYALMQVGLPLDDATLASQVAQNLELSNLDKGVLSSHEIGEAASKIAVMSDVRALLVEAQRRFAKNGKGAVLDGRDIGTVVCPDANVKLYITASSEVRAHRRFDEIINNGGKADLENILAELQKRDARDMGRKDSPLIPAEDAHLIDTTKMDIETAFKHVLAIIDEVKTSE